MRGDTMDLSQLSATEAAETVRLGEATATDLVKACLARIEQIDGGIEAWASLDAKFALAQAEAADSYKQTGGPLGPLHGVPVGVKDIYDTFDYPTQYGTTVHEGRSSGGDAHVVARLREAGAIILGKTVTTEYAALHPNKTRNPHNPDHTPGGSSSGSAAAVASGMVPLATGSQTNGSMIRPAAYCGVVGFKPSYGLIGRSGVLELSETLDQLGVFARTIEDAALLAEIMAGYDPQDKATTLGPRPHLVQSANSDPVMPPKIAFAKTAVWDQADQDCQDAFGELVEHLGEDVETINLTGIFEAAWDHHRVIMNVEMAHNLADDYKRAGDQFSDNLKAIIEDGLSRSATEYLAAKDYAQDLSDELDEVFAVYDAILSPAAPGAAPKGLDSTGSPIFSTLWQLAGVPAISLPLLQNEAGMPIGVQLAGEKGDDGRLLRTSKWLTNRVIAEVGPGEGEA